MEEEEQQESSPTAQPLKSRHAVRWLFLFLLFFY